jgi:hypothetical protein
MTNEKQIKQLQSRLRQLDHKRAAIQAKLNAIMLKHIETDAIEAAAGAQGDADLFSRLTKARLMQIAEEHWRIHHMHGLKFFETYTKEEMVNYILDIKGLPGSYKKPPTKQHARNTKGKLSSIAF